MPDTLAPSDQFLGEIIAEGGLAIPASDVANPPNTRRVRWYRMADGSVLAGDWTYDDVGGGWGVRMVAGNPDFITANGQAGVAAYASDANYAELIARVKPAAAGGAASALYAAIGNIGTKLVLDGTGASDWAFTYGPWQAPAMAANFGSFAAQYSVRYRRDPGDLIRLHGIATVTGGAPASPTTLWTLAPGFRPAAGNSHAPQIQVVRAGVRQASVLDILDTGAVNAYWTGGALAAGDIIYLDGCTFPLTAT